MPRTDDPIVVKITRAIDENLISDVDDKSPLEAIRRMLVNWPEHEDTLSIPTLHQMAGERLRRIPGNPTGA